MNTSEKSSVKRFVILESNIPYDWDDYDLLGDVYYDVAEDKIDTIKYGHGSGPDYNGETMNLEDAINNGIVTCEHLIKVMINALPIHAGDYDAKTMFFSSHSLNNPACVKVNVTGGRKFRGEGYLIYAERVPVMYGLGAYRNEYNYHPVILDPKTGTINTINSFGYLEFDKSVIDEFKNKVISKIKPEISEVLRIAHLWAYKMSYSACDTKNYNYVISKLVITGFDSEIPEIVNTIIANKIAADEEAWKIMDAKRREEKMPGIIEWVKNNTDKKTEEEIMELAEHIYKKHNK